MKTLPEGIFFRKAVSGSFMTYLLCFPLPSVSFCLCASSSSPQHCEESQLKWTCGNAHTERFGRLQGQPNSRRIYRQQFQRQKKWQVTRTPCWINFLCLVAYTFIFTVSDAFCPHKIGGCLCFDYIFPPEKHTDLLIKHFQIKSFIWRQNAEWQLSVYSFTLQQTEGPSVQCR